MAESRQNIIFSWNAKTLIGERIISQDVPTDFVDMTKDNYQFIAYPCVIEFSINKPKTGTATLEWKLLPLFYKAINQGNTNVIFAFPKSQIALSNVKGGNIDSTLKSAWDEICK